MLILLHTSKTMHQLDATYQTGQQPALAPQAAELAAYIANLPLQQIAAGMKVSDKLASTVKQTFITWNQQPQNQRTAIYSFAGDIYSGLQIHTWSPADLIYAEQTLRILSGLYGVLKPGDGIMPYRLELGYRLPKEPYRNLYQYWGDAATKALPPSEVIVDLAAKEYSKLVLPYLRNGTVVAPAFLTRSPKTGQPTFVVVHAKIARGAFAAWLIKNQITDVSELSRFNELGYNYDPALSTPTEPVFVCQQFGGLGLSVRLQHRLI